jgi:hypothetical protein
MQSTPLSDTKSYEGYESEADLVSGLTSGDRPQSCGSLAMPELLTTQKWSEQVCSRIRVEITSGFPTRCYILRTFEIYSRNSGGVTFKRPRWLRLHANWIVFGGVCPGRRDVGQSCESVWDVWKVGFNQRLDARS